MLDRCYQKTKQKQQQQILAGDLAITTEAKLQSYEKTASFGAIVPFLGSWIYSLHFFSRKRKENERDLDRFLAFLPVQVFSTFASVLAQESHYSSANNWQLWRA